MRTLSRAEEKRTFVARKSLSFGNPEAAAGSRASKNVSSQPMLPVLRIIEFIFPPFQVEATQTFCRTHIGRSEAGGCRFRSEPRSHRTGQYGRRHSARSARG